MPRSAPAAELSAVVGIRRRANKLLPVPLKINISGQVVVWRGALFAEQKSRTPIYVRWLCAVGIAFRAKRRRHH